MDRDFNKDVGKNINAKLEETLHKVLEDLETSHLRRLRAEAYDCAAKCCRDLTISKETVDKCISNCNIPIDKAQQTVSSELDRFQYRLQLCLSQCTLELKDKLSDNPTQEDIAVYNNLFQNCITSCVDSILMHVPDMIKKIKSKLNSK